MAALCCSVHNAVMNSSAYLSCFCVHCHLEIQVLFQHQYGMKHTVYVDITSYRELICELNDTVIVPAYFQLVWLVQTTMQ